jgi:hypothetical protein
MLLIAMKELKEVAMRSNCFCPRIPRIWTYLYIVSQMKCRMWTECSFCEILLLYSGVYEYQVFWGMMPCQLLNSGISYELSTFIFRIKGVQQESHGFLGLSITLVTTCWLMWHQVLEYRTHDCFIFYHNCSIATYVVNSWITVSKCSSNFQNSWLL